MPFRNHITALSELAKPGDPAITADIEFVGSGGNAHRKAVLMIHQSLAVDAAYVDAAAHGDGMTSLQFRPADGATNQETRSVLKGQVRFRKLWEAPNWSPDSQRFAFVSHEFPEQAGPERKWARPEKDPS